jgi:hypothetical protein
MGEGRAKQRRESLGPGLHPRRGSDQILPNLEQDMRQPAPLGVNR